MSIELTAVESGAPPATSSAASAARFSPTAHIKGLDTLRIVLASWVVLAHIPPPWPVESRVIKGVLGNLFTGHAAVLVFFIVSGFCIHIATRDRQLDLKSYFMRRQIRIVLPLLVLCLIGYLLGSFRFKAVLWSLVCEEIYYVAYPLALSFRRRCSSWYPVLGAATAVSLTILLLTSHQGLPPQSGYGLTAAFLYPAWLLGCVLAEQVGRIPAWRHGWTGIWAFRLIMWGISSVLSVIRWHSSISETWFLLPFCLLSYYWLRCEIAYFRQYPPPAFMEKLGSGSYTVYLTHMIAPALAAALGLPAILDSYSATPGRVESSMPGWFVVIGLVALFSTAFYLLVERPAHRLAKAVGNRLAPSKTT